MKKILIKVWLYKCNHYGLHKRFKKEKNISSLCLTNSSTKYCQNSIEKKLIQHENNNMIT